MEQLQKANLVLKVTDAFCNADRTRMTWHNINLRMLLGDMYAKHDLFNIRLDNVASNDDRLYDSNGVLTYQSGSDDNDRMFTLNLSGFNFLNSTYDAGTNNMSSSAVIGTYSLYETFSRDYNNSILTFVRDGSDRCNITIEYRTIYNDQLPSAGNSPFPAITFLFSLYGIPRRET